MLENLIILVIQIFLVSSLVESGLESVLTFSEILVISY